MKLLNKILDKEQIIYNLVVVCMLIYSFFTSLHRYIFGTRMNGVIFIMINTAIMLVFILNNRDKIRLKNISNLWIVIFVYSIFQNRDMMYGTESRWILPMCAIIIGYLLQFRDDWKRCFIFTVKVLCTVHAFFTLLFYFLPNLYLNHVIYIFGGDTTYLYNKFTSGCMSGITSHYSTNAIYLAIGVIFFVEPLITQKKKRIFDIGMFLFMCYALFSTAKRGHIAFAFIACLAMYVFYNLKNKKHTILRLVLIICGVGTILLVLSKFLPPISNALSRFAGNNVGSEVTNGRIYFWRHAMDWFKESPLFGIGWGGFKYRFFDIIGNYAANSKYVDCHNVYIQLLCEQGIVGLLLFITVTVGTLFKTINILLNMRDGRIEDKRRALTISLGIQLFFIIYCFTGNPLYDCEIFFPYILCTSISYSMSNIKRSIL